MKASRKEGFLGEGQERRERVGVHGSAQRGTGLDNTVYVTETRGEVGKDAGAQCECKPRRVSD